MKKTIITILCLFLMSCGGVSPWPSISSNPDDFANVDTATFVVDGCGSGGCDYSIDGSDYISFTSPLELTDLAEGDHTLQISSGGELVTSYTWTVDTTAPTLTMVATPPTTSNDTNPTFTFMSSESGTVFEYSTDGGLTYISCTSPLTLTDYSDGEHTVLIRATDRAGNLSLVSTSTFTIDATAPTATIVLNPDDPFNCLGIATFTFTSDDAESTFECSLNDAAFTACTSPTNYTMNNGLICDTANTFEVMAVDDAGNTGTADTFTWDVFMPLA